jgi:hypothetical protein
VQSSADEDKTPLISAFVEHFNNVRCVVVALRRLLAAKPDHSPLPPHPPAQVSFWVSTDVLMGGTPKEQAKKITKFIAVPCLRFLHSRSWACNYSHA